MVQVRRDPAPLLSLPVVVGTLDAIKNKNFRQRCNVVSEVDDFPPKAYLNATWTESAKTLANRHLFVTQCPGAKAMCARDSTTHLVAEFTNKKLHDAVKKPSSVSE